MPSEQMQRVHELFDEALKRPASERAAFVAEASGDAELRAEVESLLEHDRRAGDDFLSPPESRSQAFGAALAAAEKRPDPLIGKRVGRYQVQRVIATGGMGTVYEAVQEQPHRIVALKVMNRNVASRSALRRFHFESEILARLRHPNIAQVFEAGMHADNQSRDREGVANQSRDRERADDQSRDREGATNQSRDRERADDQSRDRERADNQSRDREGAVPHAGLPYFAMEYIPGAKTITEYADEVELNTGQRLELFGKVCDAVHHGHQKGIIHRDLKPTNILVDSAGEPKVIDFGVARATDSDMTITTIQTDVGQIVGTLQYMSPEQCDADPNALDTRSDVYALGVVLYELICGRLPYDVKRTAIHEAARVIREEPPARPSAIDRTLRGDVETITLKALQKDPEQRYQSVGDLAQDIRRHLKREPIEARPPTTLTRAVRWVARHPAVATAAICFVLSAAILGGTLLSVRLLNVRPYRIVIAKDKRSATLLTYLDRVLHTWRAGERGTVSFARLVPRPASQGGGRLAVLGFSDARGQPYGNDLCVYDLEKSLDRPAWSKGVEPDDLPESIDAEDIVRRKFTANMAWLFDVFPEPEGPEIVAVHGNTYSQRAIRIYDLGGNFLYQVWHEGTVESCHWMYTKGLLVFTGNNGQGHVGTLARVVFAIRPVRDVIERGFLHRDPDRDPESPLSPVWYKQLCPVLTDSSGELRHTLEVRSPLSGDPGTQVELALTPSAKGTEGIRWHLNADGEMIPGARVLSDAYRANLDRYPPGHPERPLDPDVLKLGPARDETPENGK